MLVIRDTGRPGTPQETKKKRGILRKVFFACNQGHWETRDTHLRDPKNKRGTLRKEVGSVDADSGPEKNS